MVSRLVGSVIANLLNDKIENLDSNQLNVSLLSGNLELRDLKIRQSILDEVNLPIVLQKGVVGKISVSVPWLNISAQPSVFTIDDVFLLCGPQTRFYVKNTKVINLFFVIFFVGYVQRFIKCSFQRRVTKTHSNVTKMPSSVNTRR